MVLRKIGRKYKKKCVPVWNALFYRLETKTFKILRSKNET